jgi:hypothetical protein
MMKSDLAVAETSLGEVDAAFQAGRYKEASAKAAAAKSNVEAVKLAVETAMESMKSAGRR